MQKGRRGGRTDTSPVCLYRNVSLSLSKKLVPTGKATAERLCALLWRSLRHWHWHLALWPWHWRGSLLAKRQAVRPARAQHVASPVRPNPLAETHPGTRSRRCSHGVLGGEVHRGRCPQKARTYPPAGNEPQGFSKRAHQSWQRLR